jgi:diguanylate cyclase (GGDEF)-like protein
MAASDRTTSSSRATPGAVPCLSPAALRKRLREEVNRAARYSTPLSCLLVTIGNLEQLAGEHGAELAEQTFEYVARALASQVRDFDRIGRPSDGELLVVLPGADGPRGEMAARRALARLRTVKVEVDGTRRPLNVSVGLAAWTPQLSADDLLEHARAAARRGYASDSAPGLAGSSPPALGRPNRPA